MPEGEKRVDRPTETVTAVWTGELRCPRCGCRLHYAYAGRNRRIEDLNRVITLRKCYYLCINVNCPLHKPFPAPQNLVLPYKKYSREVYEKVIRLYHEVGNNPKKIQSTLRIFSTSDLSMNTIQRYVDGFLFLQSDQVDSMLLTKIRGNGEMIIRVDGQRPKRNAPALWDFTDILSGEQVHAEYLKKADTNTLGEIFLKIQQKYRVLIVAVISDHQKSIVNAVKKFLPDARHQYCHFHFLENLADPLKAINSHLHAELEAGVNSLYINKASKEKTIEMAPGVQAEIQAFFEPILMDLKQLVCYPSRSFDTWGAMQSYEGMVRYVGRLCQELVPAVKESDRIGKILAKTIQHLKQSLNELGEYYVKLRFLVGLFDEIRQILGMQAYSRTGMRQEAGKWCVSLLALIKEYDSTVDLDASIHILTYRASIGEILVQWRRLYASHREGLFHFLADPRIPRTNTEQERDFSQELHFWRSLAGRGSVYYYVHLKGDLWLKTHKHYNPAAIQATLSQYSLEIYRKGAVTLRERRRAERKHWRKAKFTLNGVEEMKKRIKKIKMQSRFSST